MKATWEAGMGKLKEKGFSVVVGKNSNRQIFPWSYNNIFNSFFFFFANNIFNSLVNPFSILLSGIIKKLSLKLLILNPNLFALERTSSSIRKVGKIRRRTILKKNTLKNDTRRFRIVLDCRHRLYVKVYENWIYDHYFKIWEYYTGLQAMNISFWRF